MALATTFDKKQFLLGDWISVNSPSSCRLGTLPLRETLLARRDEAGLCFGVLDGCMDVC